MSEQKASTRISAIRAVCEAAGLKIRGMSFSGANCVIVEIVTVNKSVTDLWSELNAHAEGNYPGYEFVIMPHRPYSTGEIEAVNFAWEARPDNGAINLTFSASVGESITRSVSKSIDERLIQYFRAVNPEHD